MGLTAKQERFAEQWFATGNKSEAYRQAYNAENMAARSVRIEASRLSEHPGVTLAYAELQAQSAANASVTVESLTRMLMDAFHLAEANKDPSTMVRAVSALARLHGLNALERAKIERIRSGHRVTHIESTYTPPVVVRRSVSVADHE